jgi:hypothetical protein
LSQFCIFQSVNVWFCVANSKGLTVEAGKGYFIFFDGEERMSKKSLFNLTHVQLRKRGKEKANVYKRRRILFGKGGFSTYKQVHVPLLMITLYS